MLAGAVRKPLTSRAMAFPGVSLKSRSACFGVLRRRRGGKLSWAPLRRRRAMVHGVTQGGI
jgi:hypothetical protein